MDGDVSNSHGDQISLYGLFGDSTTTLQGLNDHLSPSLLQQSPPCGSTLSTQTMLNKVIIASPLKVIFGGSQQGVLQSDLADHSLSAGSVTVASLCSHVSFDNLRCTNLVNQKGSRFCSRHSNEVCGVTPLTEMMQEPAPSTSLKKTVSRCKSNNHISNRSTMLSTMRPMKTVKLDVKPITYGTFKAKSFDVPDSSNIASKRLPESNTDIIRQNQVCFVRKVGQQITVTNTPLGVKETESSVVKPVQTVSNIPSPLKTVIATSSPYNSKPRIVMKSRSAKTSVTKAIPRAPKTSLSNAKANGMDEDVLKKVVEVLNSRSDLTNQQQILMLQSMGITVVHGPPVGGNLTVRKKRLSKPMVKKVISIGSAKTLQSRYSTSIEPAPGVSQTVASGFSQIPSISVNYPQSTNTLPLIRPLPSAIETLAWQAMSTTQLPPNKKVRLSLSPLKGDVHSAMESLERQAVATPQFAEHAVKNIKAETKSSQKRKQKLPGVSTAKKNKAMHDKPSQQLAKSVQQAASDAKKVKHPKTSGEESKQAKRNADGKSMNYSFLTANSPPRTLYVPPRSRDCVVKLTRHLNEKALLDYSLFESKCIERGERLEPDKNKTLKSRLLKKHIAKQRKTSSGTIFNYEKCIKDLKDTDFPKAFFASKNLLHLLRSQRNGKKKVHHEKMLHDLIIPTNVDYEELSEENVHNFGSRTITDAKCSDETTAFTLGTVHLRNECNRLVEQLNQEEKELKMIVECYNDDPMSTKELLKYMIETKNDTRHSMQRIRQTIVKRCHLSSDNGLGCKAAALPYASYCRQHMWCCQSQCLYKLDQNMKSAADIIPEPLVKKVRKRTKLLPLIKRYKKKKKRKIDGNDGHNSTKDVFKNLLPVHRQQTVQSGGESAVCNSQSAQRILSPLSARSGLVTKNIKTSLEIDDSDIEDAKPSDTSEEDLNLTTNEIMLSGVLDKLADDPRDFDLFTTDKGAEELERALMLASTSPGHEPETKLDVPEFDSTLLSSAKLNSSPSATVNCDAPKSNVQPPSLDSFNKSQFIHYTFGSTMPEVVTNEIENQANDFDGEDEASPSLISAEDMQDIEGVLERLRAEDVNSPKLPFSSAVDQYTSMLARQLSQEAETESLKQQSTSTDIPNMHSSFDVVKETTMLSRSYSLPTSSIPNTLLVDKGGALMKESANNRNGIVSHAAELRQPADLTRKVAGPCYGNRPSNAVFESKDPLPLWGCVSSSLRPTTTSQDIFSKVPMSMTQFVSTVDRPSMQGTSARSVKKVTAASFMKVSNRASIPMLPRSSQPQISLSTVVSNPVLPMTLMQSPSQSGNVIKVIVPPGTMVNGTNGQQNMLLIPVSALMKQNTVHGNHNIPSCMMSGITSQSLMPTVKTQLSSLQAGQQFFIVNNHTGSTQTHLALLQRPAICSTQQGVFVKSVQKLVASQRDDCANQFHTGLKPNLNECLKQHKVSAQHAFPTTSAVGSKLSGVIANSAFRNKEVYRSNTSLSTVAKMKTQQRIGRRGKNPTKKVKAKFDPVAKKYVSMTSSTASAQVGPALAPTSLATSVDLNLTENLKKFNESALSIQSKVQQIDSVLSSLNAARSTQLTSKQLVNGHVDKKEKTSRSINSSTGRLGVVNPSPYAQVQTPVAVSFPSLQISSTTVQGKDVLTVVPKEKQPNREKAAIGKQSKTTLKKIGISAVSTNLTCPKASDSTTPQTFVPVSSGTVHWNPTTTAGPEMTTTTLTVPVYITGAIPDGSWPAELAIKGSLAGSTLPVILPAHKISSHCQLPQRVLLGSIGSLAVRSQVVSAASSSTVLKPTRTIIAPTSLPLNVSRCSVSVGQKLSVESNSIASRIQQTGNLTLQNFNGIMPTLQWSRGPASVKQTISPSSQSSCTFKPIAQDDFMVKKKSTRKASHDTILHDPLMYDPTTLYCSSPNGS